MSSHINEHQHKQLPQKRAVQDSVRGLSDVQLLKLAKLMHSNLGSRETSLQRKLDGLDPSAKRFNGEAAKARAFISAWVGQEDMNPAHVKEWNDALDAATK